MHPHVQATVHSTLTHLICTTNKTGTLVYALPLNPTHSNIGVADQQYQKNLDDYHLLKNMNSDPKKIFVADIINQWIKGAKYMVIGYSNKSFV